MAIPAHWATTTIGAMCRLTNGKTFKPSDWSATGLPIVRIQNLNSQNAEFNFYDGPVEDRYLIVSGDLLFAWSGKPGTSFGAHIWQGPKAVLNQHIFKVEFDRSAMDVGYLCAAINRTLDDQRANAHGGVGLRHVTKEAFNRTVIPLPPFPEQQRLAKTIEQLGSRTATLESSVERSIELSSACRQAVLESAFEGDLTKSWRIANPTRQSVAELLAKVPEPDQPARGRDATTRIIPGRAGISVNIPSGALPDGWQWISLLKLARQETGHTPSRRHSEYWGGTIPWLGIRDAAAHNGGYVFETQATITEAGLANSAARLLPKGTVCLSRTASVGYVTILGREMATSQDFATWTCGEALLPEYLMYGLMSEAPSIRAFGEGSVHTTIYFPEIRAFHIRLAPLQEQAEVVSGIRRALARIEDLRASAKSITPQVSTIKRRVAALAFQGELSRSDPADESATALLARMQRPMPHNSSARRPIGRTKVPKSLSDVLTEATDWLPAQEAFRRCGIASGASTDEIENIFSELRALDKAERLIVKPIFDAEGRKIEDHLRLAR